MRALLLPLSAEDCRFLVGVIRGGGARAMEAHLEAIEACGDEDAREALISMLEHEIRYLGSGDIPYQLRKALGVTPGVPFSTIIRDVASTLKVPLRRVPTDRERVAGLAEDFVAAEFGALRAEEQQQMLENLGVDRNEAKAFLKKSAGVFAIPVMVEAFGIIVVQGLIKTVLFGVIAKIIGQQLASKLLSFFFSRMPWWVGWISPAAWTLSAGWTVLHLQGPARRKTVPIVLFLGLCCLRDAAPE